MRTITSARMHVPCGELPHIFSDETGLWTGRDALLLTPQTTRGFISGVDCLQLPRLHILLDRFRRPALFQASLSKSIILESHRLHSQVFLNSGPCRHDMPFPQSKLSYHAPRYRTATQCPVNLTSPGRSVGGTERSSVNSIA